MFESYSRMAPGLESLVEDTGSTQAVYDQLCGPVRRGLPLSAFLRSCACLTDNATTLGDLLEIFREAIKAEPQNQMQHHEALSMEGFHNCLEQLCFIRKMRGATEYRIGWMLGQLQKNTLQDSGLREGKANTGFMFDPKLLTVLKQMEPGIRDLFADHVWDKSRRGLQRPTWKSILRNDTKVGWNELQAVARTFSICPDLISEEELEGIIGIMRNSELRGFSDRGSEGVALPQFEEFFCRCAVMGSARLRQQYPVDVDVHWSMAPEAADSNGKPKLELHLYMLALFRDHMRLQERFILSESESEEEVNDGFERDPEPNPRPSPRALTAAAEFGASPKQSSSRPSAVSSAPRVGFGSSSQNRPSFLSHPNILRQAQSNPSLQQNSSPSSILPSQPSPASKSSMPFFMKSLPTMRPQRPASTRKIRPHSASAGEGRTLTMQEGPLLYAKPNLFAEVQQRVSLTNKDAADPSEVKESDKSFRPTPASHTTQASKPLVIKEVMFVPDEDLPEPITFIIQSSILSHNRGDYQMALMGYAKAEQLWHGTVTARSPRAPNPGNSADPTEISSFFLLCKASVFHSQGHVDRALELFLQADEVIATSELLEEGVPPHPLQASARSGMGAVCFYAGRFKLGMKCFEDAASIRQEQLGPDHPDTAMVWNNVGACQEMLSLFEKAYYHYRLAYQVLVQQLGPAHPRTNAVMRNLKRLEGLNHGEVKNHHPLSLAFREDKKYLIPTSSFRIMAISKEKGKKKLLKKKKKVSGKKGKGKGSSSKKSGKKKKTK